MESNELIRKRVQYFYENKVVVHVRKNDGFFYNGVILEYAGDLIILDDERIGAIPIYFMEIKYIEKRYDKNKIEE
jgi:hypothetical protein